MKVRFALKRRLPIRGLIAASALVVAVASCCVVPEMHWREHAAALAPTTRLDVISLPGLPSTPGGVHLSLMPSPREAAAVIDAALSSNSDQRREAVYLHDRAGVVAKVLDGGEVRELKVPGLHAAFDGSHLLDAGDVDEDGWSDLLIIPRAAGHAGHLAGYVMSGRRGGVLHTITADSPGTRFVHAIDLLNEVGSSTTIALSMAKPGRLDRSSDWGSVDVVDLDRGTRFSCKEPPSTSNRHGWIVRWYTDVDEDGVVDLLVTDPEYRTTSGAGGRICIMSGAEGRLLTQISGSELLPQASALQGIGFDLCVMDDLDHDGMPEVALVAAAILGPDRAFLPAGYVPLVVVASLSRRTVLTQCTIPIGECAFLSRLQIQTMPDVDGDGHEDLIVLNAGYFVGDEEHGAVGVVSSQSGRLIAGFYGALASDDCPRELVKLRCPDPAVQAAIVCDRGVIVLGSSSDVP